MKYTLLGFFFIISTSCTTNVSRKVSSIDEDIRLEQLLSEVEIAASGSFNNPKQCQQVSNDFYNTFFKLDPSSFKLETISDQEISHLVTKSFNLRIKIKSLASKISNLKEDHEQCLNSVKSMQRALRYFEDYLIESRSFQSESFTTLKSEGVFFQKNPEFNFHSYKDLKSGDVILSRGNAYSSAAIARIGEADAQFSHLSFVYIDQSGEMYTTEAHIELGSFVSQIQQNIDQKNARSIVLRHKDAALAHQASRLIFEKIQMKSLKEDNIPYDFHMNIEDSSTIFCSEIISHGFSLATNNKVQVPYHKTQLQSGISTFLDLLGIKLKQNEVYETFAPADILFDNDFNIVAEWRNPSITKDAREKDAVITKMFQWMKEKNYKFHPRFSNGFKSYTAWVLRRLPWIKRNYEQKFPLNMTTDQLKLFMVLDDVAIKIHERFKSKISKLDYSPGFNQIYEILEEVKDEDLSIYKKIKTRRKSFHKYFNNF